MLVEKRSFLNNDRLFLSAKERVLNSFKSNIFPTKIPDKVPTPNATPDPTPDPTPKPIVFCTPKPTKEPRNKISSLKLHENFLNKIVNDEKIINKEIFKKYFGY